MTDTKNLTDAIRRNRAIQSIKTRFEQDPIGTLLVAAAVVTAAAKLIDATSAAQGRRAYAKQIDYKIKMK